MFDEHHRVISGNATDQALMKFLGEDSYLKMKEDPSLEIFASQKFNSSNKFSQAQIGGLTYYKGAPERLLQKADRYMGTDGSSIRWICPVSISGSILWQKKPCV